MMLSARFAVFSLLATAVLVPSTMRASDPPLTGLIRGFHAGLWKSEFLEEDPDDADEASDTDSDSQTDDAESSGEKESPEGHQSPATLPSPRSARKLSAVSAIRIPPQLTPQFMNEQLLAGIPLPTAGTIETTVSGSEATSTPLLWDSAPSEWELAQIASGRGAAAYQSNSGPSLTTLIAALSACVIVCGSILSGR